MSLVKDFIELTKIKIALSVAFTALVGAALNNGYLAWDCILLFIGVAFTAAGSATFNQLQEIEQDAKMKRTENRPLPKNRLKKRQALIFGLVISFTGISLLASFSWQSAAFGILAIFVYNLVYTPLKRFTIYALIPGALIGAIPPFIGWYSVGTEIPLASLMYLAFFLFMAQIPHFWLLLTKYYKQYSSAGFPNILQKASEAQLNRINLSWVIATCVSALFLPVFSNQPNSFVLALIMFLVVAMSLLAFYQLIFKAEQKNISIKVFIQLNLFVSIVLLSTWLDFIIS